MRSAYVIAALSRAKKLPDPRTLMISQEPQAKSSSWQDMYAAAESWAAAEGEVRTERTAS